jgi:hypothetical protein
LLLIFDVEPVTSAYRLESHTVVLPASDTLAAPLDSIVVRATARIVRRRLPDRRVELRAEFERVTVTSGLGADRTTQSSSTSFEFVWATARDGVTLPAPQATECGSVHQSARDLVLFLTPPLPDTVADTSRWMATLNSSGCRDEFIYTGTANAVLHPQGSLAAARRDGHITIVSAGESRVEGQGRQGGTAIAMRGTGSLSASYSVEAVSGALRSATATSTMKLEFDLGYRTDRFVQKSVRTATRIN